MHRAIVLVLLLLPVTAPGELPTTDAEFSIPAPMVGRSLFLDGDAIGDHLIVVGERGHILVSRDGGRGWTQARVPTRATLTGVSLVDSARGWAVGHDAVILRTRDGGDTWELVYAAPEQERPLLDVWFESADRGFAIGAYGLFLETRDGGDTWETRLIEQTGHGGPADNHLNQIAAAPTGPLYIAAERGTVYRSDDGGHAWKRLPSPYAGSFFGALPLDGERVYVYGLRGRLFRSGDAGETWRPVHTGRESLLSAGIRTAGGGVLFAGLGGTLLAGQADADTVRPLRFNSRADIAGILDAGDGAYVLFGEFGIERITAGQLEVTR